jgi:PHD/YefM family antitoxin component YafN of YafNO toxin-antitoxin module
MKTLTAEEASQDLFNLIDLVQQDSHQFCITSDIGNAVLLSEESYHSLLVTLELLATPGLMDGLKMTQNSEVSS